MLRLQTVSGRESTRPFRSRRCCPAARAEPRCSCRGATMPASAPATSLSATTSTVSSSRRTISRRWEYRSSPGRGFTDRRRQARAGSGDHQRGGGAQILSGRKSDRPAIRTFSRGLRQHRNRRRPARRQIQQSPRAAAADALYAASSEQSGRSRLHRPHGRRSGERAERRARGGERRRSQHPDPHNRNADRRRSSGVSRRRKCSRRPTRSSAASRCSLPRSGCSA